MVFGGALPPPQSSWASAVAEKIATNAEIRRVEYCIVYCLELTIGESYYQFCKRVIERMAGCRDYRIAKERGDRNLPVGTSVESSIENKKTGNGGAFYISDRKIGVPCATPATPETRVFAV